MLCFHCSFSCLGGALVRGNCSKSKEEGERKQFRFNSITALPSFADRFLLRHIDRKSPVRVCDPCHKQLTAGLLPGPSKRYY